MLVTSATESILLTNPTYGWQVAALAGTKTTGDVLTITVYNALLSSGKEPVNYTVLAADTLSTIASGLTSAINADSNLSSIGVTATASASVVNLESTAPTMTSYALSKSTGATETIAMSTGYGVQQSSYNSVNELVSISSGGAALFKGSTDKPVKSASVSTQVIKIQTALPAVSTSYSANVSKTPSETLTVAPAPGLIYFGDAYLFTVGGTPNPGDKLSITFSDVRFIPGPSETVSYTVLAGDTLSSIVTGLVNAVANDPVLNLPGLGYNAAYQTTPTFSVAVGHSYNPPPPVGITTSLTSSGTETVSLALAADENTSATIGGLVTTGDVVQITVLNSRLANGQEVVSHTVGSSETTTTIASALANAINADANLQAIGVGASSSAAVLSLNAYTYFTTSVGSGTETLTVSNANRGSANVTVGGVAKTGDVLSITAHDAALSGGQETVSYTVLSTDTLLSISQALTNAINGDSALQALKTTSVNSMTLANAQSFSGTAQLPSGKSLSAATAVDGSNNTKSNTYALSVNSGSTTNLTFDLNGDMTSDGTNSYSWDAENRMIKITYPGSNNFSTFVYDGLGRNVSIVETTAGSVTSTKQFVWCQDGRCESRDATGTITAKYFKLGEAIGGVIYFFTTDRLGSVCEMTNSSGTIQDQRSYDSFGRANQIQGSLTADMQYAGYYKHARSQLSLTRTREYSAGLGRWLTRDPINQVLQSESLTNEIKNTLNSVLANDKSTTALLMRYTKGSAVLYKNEVNAYAYVDNNPINYTDPSGLLTCPDIPCSYCNKWFLGCNASCLLLFDPNDPINSALRVISCNLGCLGIWGLCWLLCDKGK